MNLVEHLMKNLSLLPGSVQKNMDEIRKLDIACQKLNIELQIKIRSLISSWKTLSKEDRKSSYDTLRLNFQKMRELSDEKIRLSEQAYELVDKYIIKIDNDTVKINNTFFKKDCAEPSEIFETDITRKRKVTTTRKYSKRFKKENKSTANKKIANQTAPIIDMPVDPNEPTYCICGQVSFGQMVMCDNKNCLIEWFHFQCVGVTEKPRGKWYCESCSEKRRKGNM